MLQNLHVFLYQGRFLSLRVHRIDIDHIGPLLRVHVLHVQNGVRVDQVHEIAQYFGGSRIGHAASNAVFNQRIKQQGLLDERERAAQGGKHEGVACKSGRDIQHARGSAVLQADGPGYGLAAPSAELQAVGQCAFSEIDMDGGIERGVEQRYAVMIKHQLQIKVTAPVIQQGKTGTLRKRFGGFSSGCVQANDAGSWGIHAVDEGGYSSACCYGLL